MVALIRGVRVAEEVGSKRWNDLEEAAEGRDLIELAEAPLDIPVSSRAWDDGKREVRVLERGNQSTGEHVNETH